MQHRDLSERHGLRIMGMSASALRYRPQPDRNATLRTQIVQLAQRHRRYGAEMIQLKLRQAGWKVNHKRVERLYRLEQLQVRRRRRKKVPAGERQPLLRPQTANQVWSMCKLPRQVDSSKVEFCVASRRSRYRAGGRLPSASCGRISL